MKQKILAVILCLVLVTGMPVLPAHAAAADSAQAQGAEILNQIKDQLSDAFEDMDAETAGEIFSFVKEKIGEGALSSEEELTRAIEEGEEKFGVDIDPDAARQVVDTMERLEELGFSSEAIVEKAESLYRQYGADFVEHADEVVKEAVKGAVKNAANNFWDGLKNAVIDFFQNLF